MDTETRTLSLSLIDEAIDVARTYDHSIRNDYSGRGMYGDTCVGIVFDSHADVIKFLMALSALAAERSFHDDDYYDCTEAVMEIAGRVQIDSMGRGVIVYFPGYKIEEAS